ncbi:MAG: hypothetical protein LBC19_11515 [Tannerella sp.]|jgi:hypothetical protein|nr:hypothetical protein [Tannerella sp.]
MKRKLILLLACLAFFAQGSYAQDVITKKNGDGVKAKVAEISAEYVKYKKFENLTGPDYTIAASDIFMIKYEDGSRDMFEKNPQTGAIQIRHIAAETAPQNVAMQQTPVQQSPVQQSPVQQPPARQTPVQQTPVQQPPVSVPKTETAGKSAVPQSVGQDIVELLENNIIEAEITGEDITQINLRVRRLVPGNVDVRIPVGSFFVSENPAAQNMVATAEKKTRLTTNNWTSISVPAACANRPKDIPDSSDKFGIQRSPKQEELARLMPVLEKAGEGTLVKQAAVWIVTDNADFDDLGTLIDSGHARAIGYETTARAMKACAEAGIDITKKRIWSDKETILSKLSAGELKNWLQGLKDTVATSTSAPATSAPAPAENAAGFLLGQKTSDFVADTTLSGKALSSGWENGEFVATFFMSGNEKYAKGTWKIAIKPPFPHNISGLDDSYVQTVIGIIIYPMDPVIGMSWYLRAALQNDIDAVMFLGIGYGSNNEEVKNVTEAERWLRKAIEMGNQEAKTMLDNLLAGKSMGTSMKTSRGYSFSYSLVKDEKK